MTTRTDPAKPRVSSHCSNPDQLAQAHIRPGLAHSFPRQCTGLSTDCVDDPGKAIFTELCQSPVSGECAQVHIFPWAAAATQQECGFQPIWPLATQLLQ